MSLIRGALRYGDSTRVTILSGSSCGCFHYLVEEMSNCCVLFLFVCYKVRVKPNSAELEVDLSIDMDSDNYNPDAASAAKMKHEVGVQEAEKEPFSSLYLLSRMVMAS